jgi:protein-disulfide isomerase
VNDYGERVRLIFRNYPLPMHKYAFFAARAAEAAGQQGKFWEMHDALYDNQKEWSDSMEPRVQFDSYATRLGLDVQRFKADMERQDLTDRIKADMQRGNTLNVRGTPTVYLNGRELMPGKLVTEEDLRREIDAALGSAGSEGLSQRANEHRSTDRDGAAARPRARLGRAHGARRARRTLRRELPDD